MPILTLSLLPERLAVCRLAADTPLPPWALAASFFSVTRTEQELSIVCAAEHVPRDVRCEAGWRCLQVQGPLDFGTVGVLASLVSPLAQAGISIFVLSTFDTDYLLVKAEALERTIHVLAQAGHQIVA